MESALAGPSTLAHVVAAVDGDRPVDGRRFRARARFTRVRRRDTTARSYGVDPAALHRDHGAPEPPASATTRSVALPSARETTLRPKCQATRAGTRRRLDATDMPPSSAQRGK
jgi:hypothetical protein